jgi:DNA repair photolyase
MATNNNQANVPVAGAKAPLSSPGKNFHGKAIYKPNGKAGEFSAWAANFYNGCPHACSYCYNDKGLTRGTLGGTNVRLKTTLVNEQTAFKIFCKELNKWRDPIIRDGALHFNFVSDPCLPVTIDLNWRCIDYAIANNVPCQVLTKRADWLSHPAVRMPLDIRTFSVLALL